jgi:predicted DNA-binding antitoxin AbrB/MazE fold protein
MTKQVLDAVYEHGTLRLLSSLDAKEGQRVRVSVEPVEEEKENVLELMFHFYDDVPEEERREIEKIILDRRDFFGDRQSA